jgi:hypothetical protein
MTPTLAGVRMAISLLWSMDTGTSTVTFLRYLLCHIRLNDQSGFSASILRNNSREGSPTTTGRQNESEPSAISSSRLCSNPIISLFSKPSLHGTPLVLGIE